MNYFDHHGWALLFMWACFPRITFWFISSMTGGFGFWLGVLFVPHIMVAFWATVYYWNTNPWLCFFAWVIALGGSSKEKKVIEKRVK